MLVARTYEHTDGVRVHARVPVQAVAQAHSLARTHALARARRYAVQQSALSLQTDVSVRKATLLGTAAAQRLGVLQSNPLFCHCKVTLSDPQ